VIDARTGEIRSAQIFVAVLGASNYTYAEATWSQSLPDWIGSHQRSFTFLAACLNWLSPITCAQASPKRTFMSRPESDLSGNGDALWRRDCPSSCQKTQR